MIKISEKAKKTYINIIIDLLLFAALLIGFALFHHVIPYKRAIDLGKVPFGGEIPDFSEKFADKFTSGEVLTGENFYRSDKISLTVSEEEYKGAVCHICDVYVKNAAEIKSAFASGTFGKNLADSTLNMSVENNSVFAASGDYYGIRDRGIVIRNGMIYRTEKAHDVCVLYYNGEMKTYDYGDFNVSNSINSGAWQAWDFGPKLLNDAKAIKEFNTGISGKNPRMAIGYYEPGHYVFTAIDGRQESSSGLSLVELSAFFEKLGCKEAYNLDGGHSAVMTLYGEIINSPSKKGGRDISDIIYLSGD